MMKLEDDTAVLVKYHNTFIYPADISRNTVWVPILSGISDYMLDIRKGSRLIIAALTASMFLFQIFPLVAVVDAEEPLPDGFRGVSYEEMTSIDKVTLVNHDREGVTDDYAYLAEVSASVFRYGDRVLMNPVLFYEPEREVSDEERVHNTYPAVKYLMEDLVTVADGELDRIELVGFDGRIPGDVGSAWKASEVEELDSDSIYGLADMIALENWEYSDNAVLAVVDPDPGSLETPFNGEMTDRTPDASSETGMLTGAKEPSPVDPNYHQFDVGADYKYITSQLTWGKDWNPLSDITERGKDPDLQLYDEQLGQVGASEKWNVLEGASEEISSYIYNPGSWKFAVTYMPTENSLVHMDDPEGWGAVPDPSHFSPAERESWREQRIRTLMDDRRSEGLNPDAPFGDEVEYTIDYTLYPGIDLPMPVETPFYCRDATFTLEWDDASQNLGLILRGPEGAEIAVATAATGGTNQVLEIPALGQGDYQVSVINLAGNGKATDFTLKWEFKQMKKESEAYSWANGANGAVLASTYNSPLLFCSRNGVPDSTQDALNTLGVDNIKLVDVNGDASGDVYDDIDSMRGFLRSEIDVETIDSFEEIYSAIDERTYDDGVQSRDVVFTTMDGWTSWKVLLAREAEENPKEEVPGALFIGPAALAGAIHGAPVLINEAHPDLSTAQAWHNEFWKYAYHNNRAPPSVACMILTGRSVYEVLDRYGLDVKKPVDENGKCKESIITVADQFDIGSSWDRAITGASDAGRIMGTPVDTAAWVSRSGLYPKVIYANPAVNMELDEHEGKRIQGSSSSRVAGKLVIDEPERETVEKYAVVETWVSYQYKFNEIASEYWGTPYTTRTGYTPWFDKTGEEVDPDGIDPDGRFPDLDSSEVIPHYLEQLGYGQAFTTTFEKTTENLNRGAIMWLEVMHGGHTYSGVVGWWDEEGATEQNPWRGYEETGVPMGSTEVLRLRGSTEDPDVVTMSKHVGLDVVPGVDEGPLGVRPTNHDGVIIAISQQGQTEYSEDGLVMDEAFENLHSMGFSGGSCLIANTYLQLMMVRHGSVFQVIDPWLTSWYSAVAMNLFMRDLYYGYTVGQAYERGISHVGIDYLNEGWWWDIFENLVYFGDPDLYLFTPKDKWDEPAPLQAGAVLGGHSPFGSEGHPHATGSGLWMDALAILALLGIIGAGAYVYYARKKGIEIPYVDRWLKKRSSSN